MLVQVYRPQEAVIAAEHLLVAYDQYFATVAEYNRALEVCGTLSCPGLPGAGSCRSASAGRRHAGQHKPPDVPARGRHEARRRQPADPRGSVAWGMNQVEAGRAGDSSNT